MILNITIPVRSVNQTELTKLGSNCLDLEQITFHVDGKEFKYREFEPMKDDDFHDTLSDRLDELIGYAIDVFWYQPMQYDIHEFELSYKVLGNNDFFTQISHTLHRDDNEFYF